MKKDFAGREPHEKKEQLNTPEPENWSQPDLEAEKHSLTPAEEAEMVQRLTPFTLELPTAEQTNRLAEALANRWQELALADISAREERVAQVVGGEQVVREEREEMAERTEWVGQGDGVERAGGRRGFTEGRLFVHLLRWIRPQIRLFSWPFWIVSAVIAFSGVLLGGGVANGWSSPLIFIAPLLAVASVCIAFRSFGTPMFELELSFPITPAQLVFGRLAVIIGYDVALMCLASLLTGRSASELVWFVLSWFVPLGAASVAALAVMLYFGVLAGLVSSLFVWGVQLMMNRHLGVLFLFSGESYENWLASKLIGLAAIVLFGAAVLHKTSQLRGMSEVTR